MNISVCITLLNEERSVSSLIDSLINQTLKPSEIIIVDGGSKDKTVEIIRHFQKKDRRIKLLIEKSSRARGRNIAAEVSKGSVLVFTDGDCVAKRNWIKNLTHPFKNLSVDMVAGFYDMKAGSDMKIAIGYFLGVIPSKFDANFLPSARSMAIRKDVFENLGGFPETANGVGEDTLLNFVALKNGVKIARAKDARVEWEVPSTLTEFFRKVYSYAKADRKTNIWIFPSKGVSSHNIKALFVLLRYLIGLTLFILGLANTSLLLLTLFLVLAYIFYSYRKVYLAFGKVIPSLWGVILQFVSDLGVMVGFLSGYSLK